MSNLHRLIAVTTLVLASGFAAPAAAQDDTSAVQAHLESWAATYSSPDASPDRMLKLYHPDSVFWGTGARTPFVGAEQIAPYFAQQFANFPERKVSFIDPIIRVYGQTATATGLYRFEVRTRQGDLVDVTHRFSFALNKGENGWIFVQQHSSQLPQ